MVEGAPTGRKKSGGLCFRILGDPMRWNIGRLASSRGRAWWLFERVGYIRESVGCAEFYCTDRRDYSLIIDAEKRTQVGLDAAGKTTILYKLKLGEIVTTIPTIGTFLRVASNGTPSPRRRRRRRRRDGFFARLFDSCPLVSGRTKGGHFRFSSNRRFVEVFCPKTKKKKKKHVNIFYRTTTKLSSSSSSSLLKTS